MNNEKKFSYKKGITFIACVITIIVLFILTGVSITLIIGENGIINKAKISKEENVRSQALEKLQLEVMGSYEDGILSFELLKENIKNNLCIEIIETSFPININMYSYSFIISEDCTVEVDEELKPNITSNFSYLGEIYTTSTSNSKNKIAVKINNPYFNNVNKTKKLQMRVFYILVLVELIILNIMIVLMYIMQVMDLEDGQLFLKKIIYIIQNQSVVIVRK